MNFVKFVIGQPVAKAEEMLKQYGFNNFRIRAIDGITQNGSSDKDDKRVNFIVKNNVVSEVYLG